jgi:hypothetical protein
MSGDHECVIHDPLILSHIVHPIISVTQQLSIDVVAVTLLSTEKSQLAAESRLRIELCSRRLQELT